MRISILKFVFFSIIICSFEYVKNELYFVNDRGIYLERDVINFKNNKILADVDNQFDFNEFYESTLSLASQLGDCIEGNKEIAYLQSIIDSHIKKHKENNTLPDLNNVDKKTKKLIDQLRKELEEIKKELNNKRSSEVEIQPIKDKIITKKNKNNSVSEQEDFKQLENSENTKIASSNNYKKFKINRKLKDKTTLVILGMFILSIILVISLGTNYLAILLIPCAALIIDKYWKSFKKLKKSKI
ncbi:fam-b protein [Plasmodium berghei]|uniref:Fam-b protein n=4 Tax=Plasmodium berghei TaxID=5821 RepID=A0A509AGA3_PLABA|nr:fam-b protein [Plasmodium berghei ANKA]SBW38190.1 fam-b protein [Plasmodium berghei]SCL82085.1 fam-b protein [Plasmodium berghei]SCL86720.1 fam-b protein [Plasmodium berghei]VUC54669.1 fam-b protein [Plasmodium berghei ANKA]|eukprot:XP_034420496.1 fam-b protein [Plasmodium berghei ANKA]